MYSLDMNADLALLAIISTPHPCDDDFLQLLSELLVILLMQPPDGLSSIRHRLGDPEHPLLGRNVFRLFARHPYEFFEATGESPESLLGIIKDISQRCTLNRYSHILSPINRVMASVIPMLFHLIPAL